jgi:hypothetical protein
VRVVDLTSIAGFTGQSLSSIYSSALARARQGSGSGAGQQAAATKPGDFRVTQPRDLDAANNALRTTRLIDTNNAADASSRLPEDQRRLFSLYRGLQALQALAATAADAQTTAPRAAEFDRRFQSGLAEIKSFTDGLRLSDAQVFFGAKTERAETSLSVARPQSVFTGRAAARGLSTNDIPGFATAEAFTIRVRKNNADIDVVIDPAEIAAAGSTSTGATVAFINTKLEAAGIQSRLSRVEVPGAPPRAGQPAERAWAIRVQTFAGEPMSFLSSAPRASVTLLAQGAGAADLRKFDVSGAEPAAVSQARIEAASRDITTSQMARDAAGNVFVLGTTDASFGGQVNQAPRDAVLRKLDSAGNVLWTKLLGSAARADGMALAVGPQGEAVIAGRIEGRLGPAAGAGGDDAWVVKYDADGAEVFAQQFGTRGADAVTGLTIAADGTVYAGGRTGATLTGQGAAAAANAGGNDAFLASFSATGARGFVRQWGTAGDDRLGAMGLAADGGIVTAATEGGRAMVRKFDAAGAVVWTKDLGEIQGGAITAFAREGNALYIAGATGNAALTANGEASIAASHSGASDGFVLRLDDAGASAVAGLVSYVGSGVADRINGLAVMNGQVFVAGDTAGTIPGANTIQGDRPSAFMAKLETDGMLGWARQFAGPAASDGFGRAIVADAQGASVLDMLGLPKGALNVARPQTVTANSTLRAGDYLGVSVSGGTARRVTIAQGDTMSALAGRLNQAMQFQGRAEVVRTSQGERIRIVPVREGEIDLRSGPRDLDALAGLGLAPGRVMRNENPASGEGPEDGANLAYGLGLRASGYSLADRTSAGAARTAMANALQQIRDAYRAMTFDPAAERALRAQQGAGEVSPQLRAQIANYTAGLQRLQGGG